MRPLSVYDLFGLSKRQHELIGDHWYWCRRHHRAEHCEWSMVGCWRVGPFHTELEAQSCTDLPRFE